MTNAADLAALLEKHWPEGCPLFKREDGQAWFRHGVGYDEDGKRCSWFAGIYPEFDSGINALIAAVAAAHFRMLADAADQTRVVEEKEYAAELYDAAEAFQALFERSQG